MKKWENISPLFASFLVAMVWLAGAIFTVSEVQMDVSQKPVQLLMVKSVMSLYVAFLFESAVSIVEIMASDRRYGMGPKALRTLLILTLGAAFSILSSISMMWYEITWPVWIIVFLCFVEKFDVELFKKDESSYFTYSHYSKIPFSV